MTNNTKTPVMVLQELSIKRGWLCPNYSIVHARQGTHDNEFHYQVVVHDVSAIGIGRSKQVAKHSAAQKALDKLAEKGLCAWDEATVKAPKSEVTNGPVNLILNSIGTLEEICAQNKLPRPKFTEISEVGPPHCKEFTYQCQITSIITKITAGSKKQAKQLAAKEMLERIMHSLPELVHAVSEEEFDGKAITEKDEKVIAAYNQLKPFKRPKPNLGIKVTNYDLHIKSYMEDKDLKYSDLLEYFNKPRTEENLSQLLEKLELSYLIETYDKSPSFVILSINTDVPLSTIGKGNNVQAALTKAIEDIFDLLHILME